MTPMLEELTMLADILDAGGFKLEAEAVDSIIKYSADQSINRRWTREVEAIVNKVQDMLYNNKEISDALYDELITDLNKYLVENEREFKEKDPTDRSFDLEENQVVTNLKNLLAEMPEEIDENGKRRQLTVEESRNKERDLNLIAKNMQVFRSLESSEKQEDRDRSASIRKGLGNEAIIRIERLLQNRANDLRINELTLPPILSMALKTYREVESKINLIRSKLQGQDVEIKKVTEELNKHNMRYTQNWSQEKIEEESKWAQEAFNKKEYLEGMQQFYRDQLKERDSKLKELKAHIQLLNVQLQIVAGANVETAKQINDSVGADNIKALIEIGKT